MGTNIYARPIKQYESWNARKQENITEAQNANLIGLVPLIEEYWNDRKPQPIHIGKRSAGWRFLFNHNDWKYYTTIEELKEFLKECEITTEYGTTESFEDFWENVEHRQGLINQLIEELIQAASSHGGHCSSEYSDNEDVEESYQILICTKQKLVNAIKNLNEDPLDDTDAQEVFSDLN